MILKITSAEDKFIEETYDESMKDLNNFYEINWIRNTPTIVIAEDRKTINIMRQKETPDWNVGWINSGTGWACVLDRNNLEKESSHKYKPETYKATIKHELSHLFYRILCGGINKPNWLWEGTAIYTSGQNKFKRQPSEFKEFLEFYEKSGSGVYYESGFFVQFLVEKFGKQRLLNLIKKSKDAKTEVEFNELFAKEYGFKLNYNEINKNYKEPSRV